MFCVVENGDAVALFVSDIMIVENTSRGMNLVNGFCGSFSGAIWGRSRRRGVSRRVNTVKNESEITVDFIRGGGYSKHSLAFKGGEKGVVGLQT